jgi:hypothetical protein
MKPADNDKKPLLDLTRLAIELKAAGEGVRAALSEHKRRRESVVIWQNGKVVELPPEEIPEDQERDE